MSLIFSPVSFLYATCNSLLSFPSPFSLQTLVQPLNFLIMFFPFLFSSFVFHSHFKTVGPLQFFPATENLVSIDLSTQRGYEKWFSHNSLRLKEFILPVSRAPFRHCQSPQTLAPRESLHATVGWWPSWYFLHLFSSLFWKSWKNR